LQQVVRFVSLPLALIAALVLGSYPPVSAGAASTLDVHPLIDTGPVRPIAVELWTDEEPERPPQIAVEVRGITFAGSEPALPPSILESHQVVSFYGFPNVEGMGELGRHDPEAAAEHIKRLAAEYDALNGDRPTVGALHLIVDVAQAKPTSDGLFLERLDLARIAEYVEVAREHDLLLFLDLQIGWSDALEDTRRLEWFLREPFVHLALDPEFATGRYSTAPGLVIGSLDADEVNEVQDFLAELVREAGIPPKLLVVHQFQAHMLIEPERFANVPEVEVTIDMDGFGGVGPKLGGYRRFALADYAERSAFKLFYRWDEPIMTPEQILGLDEPPDYIIYQ